MVAAATDGTNAAIAEHAAGVASFSCISDTRDYTHAECCSLRTSSERQRPAVPNPDQQAAGADALHKVLPTPFSSCRRVRGRKGIRVPYGVAREFATDLSIRDVAYEAGRFSVWATDAADTELSVYLEPVESLHHACLEASTDDSLHVRRRLLHRNASLASVLPSGPDPEAETKSNIPFLNVSPGASACFFRTAHRFCQPVRYPQPN